MREPFDVVENEHGTIPRRERYNCALQIDALGIVFRDGSLYVVRELRPELAPHEVDCHMHRDAAQPSAKWLHARPPIQSRNRANPRFLYCVLSELRIASHDAPRGLKDARGVTIIENAERVVRSIVLHRRHEIGIRAGIAEWLVHSPLLSFGACKWFAAPDTEGPYVG